MIRREQSCVAGDDSVPVVVGVARESDVEAILHSDQRLHRVGRGWIHTDATVPIDGYEPERRIDLVVGDAEVQAVALGDRCPVVYAGAAERIDTHADAGAADHVHVDDFAKIADVSAQEVMPVRRRRTQRF